MSVVLVTGASGGLGTTVVSELNGRGWTVLDINSRHGDLADPAVAQHVVDLAGPDLTSLVHLVGGIVSGNPLEDILVDDLHRMISLNLVTTFNVLHAALPVLKRNKQGSIVTIGSQSVIHPVIHRSAYSASKAAVASLTQAIAEEGRPFNVRANTIIPSIIRTPATLTWASAEESQGWPTPEQIAHTIGDLIDPHCAISGALLPIFGTIPF